MNTLFCSSPTILCQLKVFGFDKLYGFMYVLGFYDSCYTFKHALLFEL